jgi:predicted nucleotidyltransferase
VLHCPTERPDDCNKQAFSVRPNIELPSSVRATLLRVAECRKVKRIVVFGSRAVGDNEATSDTDVALFAPGLSPLEFVRLKEAVYESPTLYWISLVHFDVLPSVLQTRILGQGVTVYEQTQSSR